MVGISGTTICTWNHPVTVKTIMASLGGNMWKPLDTYITTTYYNFNVVQEPASSHGQQNLRHKRIGRLHPSEETSRIRIAFGQ
jgi:hypothetical protein